jgi:hypothetical protein
MCIVNFNALPSPPAQKPGGIFLRGAAITRGDAARLPLNQIAFQPADGTAFVGQFDRLWEFTGFDQFGSLAVL